MDKQYLQECEERRKIVANTLAVGLTATEGPNKAFMDALDDYIYGRLSLEELERKTKQMEYLEDPIEKQKRLNFESDARTHTDW